MVLIEKRNCVDPTLYEDLTISILIKDEEQEKENARGPKGTVV